VRAAVVVLGEELIELGLQFGDGGGAGLGFEPFLQGLVVDLPLVWGVRPITKGLTLTQSMERRSIPSPPAKLLKLTTTGTSENGSSSDTRLMGSNSTACTPT
jgi:hypothetical protein